MSEECIFCHRDPYHYVDIGVGFQAAAVNCCELGVALYQYRDEGLAKVANRIEELEAKLNKLLAVSERALMLSLKYSHFKLHAMEPMHKAIAAAKIKGEQP